VIFLYSFMFSVHNSAITIFLFPVEEMFYSVKCNVNRLRESGKESINIV
jgi:hypothetical protein